MPEYSAIYEDAVDRIQSVYHSCSKPEQKLLKDILTEMSIHGYSQTLEQVWLSDFKSIPVGIDQFLNDPEYLGQSNNFGKSVYPFWRQTFKNIFNAGNRYNEILLSGATRTGKSTSSVTIMAYMLYRLMLYRDPHEYFHKKAISKFTLGFANLTKELALSVCYREFNDTLKASPWFSERGSFTRSDRNFYYLPEGDKIEIVPASSGEQLLGKQVWCCLAETTVVCTENGDFKIKELVNNDSVAILQHGADPCIARSMLMRYVTETVVVWLSELDYLEGTPDHELMLSDGSYKEMQDLTLEDKLMSIEGEATAIQRLRHCHFTTPVPVYDMINMNPNHNFIVKVGGHRIVSHNCVIDEANFAKTGVKDINKAKAHMKSLYDTVNARISGTFRLGGEVYGKLITSSSKNQDNDYLSDHIETQIRAGNEHLYLVDEPQWKVLPPEMFSDESFHFTVGDRYKKGFVIPEENDDEEHRREYESQGYTVVEAPAELRKNFLADYDISLRDIAGISVAGAMGFITQEMVTPCIAQDRQNPFFEDVIVLGRKDDRELSEFFHLAAVPNELKNQQMNVHIDLAETKNRIGISGSCVAGNKVIENEEGRKLALPFIKQVFSVGIEAPRGEKMSYQKVVNFIVWLRQNYFNLGTISFDQFQSSFAMEVLEQQNFTTKKISLSRSMDPYIGIKNLLYDQRIELVKNQKQEDELISIQRVGASIELPIDEDGGHCDIAEALTGSAYTLISDHVSARPPARNLASIAAAVNTGRGARAANPMSSANTIPGRPSANQTRPVKFPKLR